MKTPRSPIPGKPASTQYGAEENASNVTADSPPTNISK